MIGHAASGWIDGQKNAYLAEGAQLNWHSEGFLHSHRRERLAFNFLL